jgi:CBS domain-containing protein
MKVRDVMTSDPQVIAPDATLQDVARLMRDLDVGSVPVCENDHRVGMITDRDIVVRAEAAGKDPVHTHVREAMTPGVAFCRDDDNVNTAIQRMEEKQIRRLPVINKDKRLAGIVSLGDLAVNASTRKVGEALEHISEPSRPKR